MPPSIPMAVQFLSITHIFGQFFSSEYVEVDVLNRLASVLANVGDNSVTVRQTASRRYLGYSLENGGNALRVVSADGICRFDMLARNHKHVNGRLGIDVAKRVDLFVLIYLGGGNFSSNYFTKQTRRLIRYGKDCPFYFIC